MANELRILLAISLIGLGGSPAQASSAPIVTNYVAEQPAINQTRFILLFEYEIENLEKDDFEYNAGCSLGYLEIQGATAQVDLMDCPSGLVTLTLKSNSMGAGTLGPKSDLKFEIEIDATEPTANFSEIEIAGSGPFTYTTLLRFSEAIEFDSDRLRFESSTSCDTSIIEVADGLRLRATCGYTDLSWTLPARSLKDTAGHLGPNRDLRASVTNPAPAPVPTPTPPVQNPVLPPPSPVLPPVINPPTPPPATSEPVLIVTPTESESVPEAVVEPWSESAMLPMEPPVFVLITPGSAGIASVASGAGPSQLDLLQLAKPEPVIEKAPAKVETLANSAEMKTSLKAVAVSDAKSDFQRWDNSFGIWLIGAGSAILIAFGLIRRFSGR